MRELNEGLWVEDFGQIDARDFPHRECLTDILAEAFAESAAPVWLYCDHAFCGDYYTLNTSRSDDVHFEWSFFIKVTLDQWQAYQYGAQDAA